MEKRTIFLLIGAIFVAVMVYISIDMLSKTTPPWKRVKKKATDSLMELSGDRILFPDTTIFVYKVQKNESISSIADKFYCKIDSIKLWNELASNNLKENQSLLIKVRAIHLVEKNEFLEKIAQKYSVDMKTILKANGIKKPEQLRANQKLIIPKQR
jgi:LysM repeat protein